MKADWLRQPRTVAIACALTATGMGIAYLVMAGAPLRYPVVNAVALLLGLVALRALTGAMERTSRSTGYLLLALASSQLMTALIGASADGASRWIWIGPLSVQVSLLVMPAMIVLFARNPTTLGSFAVSVAAAGLALQPDRAMAGVLAFSMAVLAVARPGRSSLAAVVAAIIGFAAAMAQPDALPAVPFVDRILFTAFDIHMLAGAAVLVGSLLLLVPAIAGWRSDPARRHVYLVFGAVWLGCIVAAVVGNYPTPVVGYGGSAILGYLLSLACIPAQVRSVRAGAANAVEEEAERLAGLRRSASPA